MRSVKWVLRAPRQKVAQGASVVDSTPRCVEASVWMRAEEAPTLRWAWLRAYDSWGWETALGETSPPSDSWGKAWESI